MKIELLGSWSLSLWENEYQDVEVTGNVIKVIQANGNIKTIKISCLDDERKSDVKDAEEKLPPQNDGSSSSITSKELHSTWKKCLTLTEEPPFPSPTEKIDPYCMSLISNL